MIVEAEHTIALRAEKRIPPGISHKVLRLEMLPAVDLDDQAGLAADKIHDKRTNRRLSFKASTAEPMGPQRIPNDTLRVSQ